MAPRGPVAAAGRETSRPPLIGREAELGVLAAGLQDALNGHGGLFVVSGEAGMGKTRLAEWVAERAREQGAPVMWGRCWESVEAPAYWPWSQVIRQALERFDDSERDGFLGPSQAAIARMVPETVDRNGVAEETTTRIEEFDAVTGFFKRAAEREPIVLVFEDVHAADESSQLMLAYLAHETRDDRIFVVATFDPDAGGMRAHRPLLADVAREGTSISLRGIDEGSIAQLFEILLGTKPPAPISAGLHHATEGNPLFVTEAITMLNETGELNRPDHSAGFRVPRNVRDMLRRRLDGLDEETRALLTMASAIGREFDLSLLAQVAALDPDTSLDLLDPAVAAKVIEETGALGRYRFTHALIRETVYEDLSAANRMRLHRLVAEAVEGAAGTDAEARLPELAQHWFKAAQAGDPVKALAYIERAAQRAAAQGANEEAARLYRRALKVADLAAARDDHIAVLKEALLTARSATGNIYPEGTASSQEHRFGREGEYWTLVYQGVTSRLKDSKGLGFLAQLLAAPGRELHVLDLVNAARSSAEVAPGASTEDLHSDGLGDAGEVLDATAKAAYRRRISDLKEEIEEADAYNDPERSARAQEELDALVRQLSGAVGLGGRDRKAASVAERARMSVTKTIKDALRKISENDPTLGSHLVSTIKTGTFCSYTPDPRVPVRWQI